ncbi:MAG: hypothetical protein ACFFEK_10605 [Candidatus Thorarchaeota archaeon]
MNNENVIYPQTPLEWIEWIHTRLEIDGDEGTRLFETGEFPFNNLVRIWEEEFDAKNGYHPSFIPALVRNKVGFVKWVYCKGPEPNWTKSDD